MKLDPHNLRLCGVLRSLNPHKKLLQELLPKTIEIFVRLWPLISPSIQRTMKIIPLKIGCNWKCLCTYVGDHRQPQDLLHMTLFKLLISLLHKQVLRRLVFGRKWRTVKKSDWSLRWVLAGCYAAGSLPDADGARLMLQRETKPKRVGAYVMCSEITLLNMTSHSRPYFLRTKNAVVSFTKHMISLV